MKTSKIIFISFFAVVGLFLLSLLIQVKIDNPNDIYGPNSVVETKPLPKFSHLVLDKSPNITLRHQTSDSIRFRYAKTTSFVQPNYFVQNDTLFFDSIPNQPDSKIILFASNLKSITIKGAKIYIDNIEFSNLEIKGVKSNIYCENTVSFDSLMVDLNLKSDFRCYNAHINSHIKFAKIVADNSEVRLDAKTIKVLQADLRNHSELTVKKVLHSDVISDQSSRFYSR